MTRRLTTDQFDDGAAPVIVTRQSSWHAAWKAEPSSNDAVGLDYYDPASGAVNDYARLRFSQ
jgi:hypothetical protein